MVSPFQFRGRLGARLGSAARALQGDASDVKRFLLMIYFLQLILTFDLLVLTMVFGDTSFHMAKMI